MKILTILGDSLATVRPEEKIATKDLYSFKVQKELGARVYVVNRARGGNTAVKEDDLESFIFDITAAESSFFVIHLGIVDCAPRIFTEYRKTLIEKWSSKRFVGRFFRYYIRKKSKNRFKLTEKKLIVYTPPADFEKHLRSILQKILDHNPVEKVYFVNIAFPGPKMTSRTFGILEQIQKYNSLIFDIVAEHKSIAELIDVFTLTKNQPDLLLEDGHHFDPRGHDYIARELKLRMTPLLGLSSKEN